jgi:hypothetical protein
MAAPIPSTGAGKPQNHAGKRPDASKRRHDALHRVLRPSGAGKQRKPSALPLRTCKRVACSIPFVPSRVDQEYHSADCRKRASFDRKYVGPVEELRGALANVLRHFDTGLKNGSLASIFTEPEPPATEFERDLAAARTALKKRV